MFFCRNMPGGSLTFPPLLPRNQWSLAQGHHIPGVGFIMEPSCISAAVRSLSGAHCCCLRFHVCVWCCSLPLLLLVAASRRPPLAPRPSPLAPRPSPPAAAMLFGCCCGPLLFLATTPCYSLPLLMTLLSSAHRAWLWRSVLNDQVLIRMDKCLVHIPGANYQKMKRTVTTLHVLQLSRHVDMCPYYY